MYTCCNTAYIYILTTCKEYGGEWEENWIKLWLAKNRDMNFSWSVLSGANKREYSFIPNERVGLLFWANFIGLNKQVGWKIC